MLRRGIFLASAAYVAAQSSTTREPCAVVASAQAAGTKFISAQTAYDCLNSVPVDVKGNTVLIEELKTVWQFQSEHTWLKNPGNDWEYGPLDIDAELDKIKSSLGSYSSEYAVQLAIQNITIRTGNFHFNYQPDILSVFQFGRQFNIASISSDGKSLPKLYIYEDTLALAKGRKDVSALSKINSQDPYDFLKSTFFSQYIDSDGQMNAMFAKGDTDNAGAFANQAKYDGPRTNLTWANGTTASLQNIASTVQSFRKVNDGPSFFTAFCNGQISGSSPARLGSKTSSIAQRGAPGPVPRIPTDIYHRRDKRDGIPGGKDYTDATLVSEAPSGVVAGYFLTGKGYDNIAVLKIISFSDPDSNPTNSSAFSNDFQSTVKTFLAKCTSSKKQKLIIDLRENGGGDTDLLLDTFMQLFPNMEPFSGQRYRSTDAWTKLGDAVNEIHTDSAKSQKFQRLMSMSVDEFYRFWAWWQFRAADGKNFDSWNQFNGPLDLNGDKVTVTMRYNYSNTNHISILSENFNFVSTANLSPAFSPSDVIMYTDALCGSSCASFHEELKNIAGVRSITVGGRPQNRPIQAITGSKGGEVISLMSFPEYASNLLNISSSLSLKSVSRTDKALTPVANLRQLPVRAGDSMSRLQSQDQVRKGDSSGTPLQYIYEAADCRLFYTPTTFLDPDAAWKQAFDAWQDNTKCVDGSTGHNSSISGGFKPYGNDLVAGQNQTTGSSTSGSGTKKSSKASNSVQSGGWGSVVAIAGVVSVVVAAVM